MSEIEKRLEKNYKARRPLCKNWPTEAYRLYERDLPNYPFIVDVYQNECVIWFKGKKRYEDDTEKEQQIKAALAQIFSIDESAIHSKHRSPQKRFERYQKFGDRQTPLLVQEGPAHFEVNLTDYLDTGLFLDHRPLRARIQQECQKLAPGPVRLLNLFCYTGSISVMAALQGAETWNIDLSKTYLDWAQRNFTHNQLDLGLHHFLRHNAADLTPVKHLKFDLIYVDPPTFSNSKKTSDFDVQLHHRDLLFGLKKLLTERGTLIFSCNRRDFQLEPSLKDHFHIADWTRASIPEDFRDQGIHHCFFLKHKQN